MFENRNRPQVRGKLRTSSVFRRRSGAVLALTRDREEVLVLIRFTESVRVRLWGRELERFRKGEIHAVAIAIAAVLFAQGCAEPVADPPALPHVRVA